MMQNLNDMIIFAKVAESQGISPAARALRIPKSKVSRRMQALEDELGVGLLERSTRSVHLTEAGSIFYQHCKRMVEEAESARISVNQLMEAPRGLLRINTSVSIGQYLIAPHLSEFMAAYPEIKIDLQLENRRVDVIAEGYDVVVRVGDLPDSEMVSKRLLKGRALMYASPDYLKKNGAPKKLGDIQQHRVLVMSDVPKSDQWTLQNRQQLENITIFPQVTTNDFPSLLRLTTSGAGIALLPDFLSRGYQERGELQQVLPQWKSPAYALHALYPSHRGLTLKTRAWLDFFSEKLNRTPPPSGSSPHI